MDSLKVLAFKDKGLLEDRLGRFQQEMWSYNAGYLYGYKAEKSQTFYTLYHDTMILVFNRGKSRYLPVAPLHPDPEKMREALDYAFSVLNVRLCESFPGYLKRAAEDRYELVFGTEEFLCPNQKVMDFSGSSLQKKRNTLSKFKKENPDLEVCEYRDSDNGECFRLAQLWRDQFLKHRQEKLIDSIYAKGIFKNHKKVGLKIQLIRIKGELKAFSVGYGTNTRTWYHLLTKYDHSFNGLSDFSFQQMARAFNGKEYANQGPTISTNYGLLSSKKKFDPLKKYVNYVIIPKRGG